MRSHYTYRGQNKSQNRQSEGRDYYSESQKFWEDFARQYNEYANQNSNSYQNSYNNYQNSYNSYQNATSSSGMTKAQAYKILGLEYESRFLRDCLGTAHRPARSTRPTRRC